MTQPGGSLKIGAPCAMLYMSTVAFRDNKGGDGLQDVDGKHFTIKITGEKQ